jgi:hypothetical protein
MYSSGIALRHSVRRKTDYAITAVIPSRIPQGATRIDDPNTVESFLEAMAAAGVDVPRSAVAAVRGNSFSDMAKHVMSDRGESGQAQLVIVAHSTPDVNPSGVPAIDMLALQRPTADAAFTLCDEGPSIAYTAIEVARQFAARYEYDRVLILLAENSTFPYTPRATAAEMVDADAAVLLVLEPGTPADTTIERRVVPQGASVDSMRAAVIDLVRALQSHDEDGGATVWVLGSQLHEFAGDVAAVTGADIHLSAAGQPVTAVWSDAMDYVAPTGSLSSVLIDYDGVAGMLVACRLRIPGIDS